MTSKLPGIDNKQVKEAEPQYFTVTFIPYFIIKFIKHFFS